MYAWANIRVVQRRCNMAESVNRLQGVALDTCHQRGSQYTRQQSVHEAAVSTRGSSQYTRQQSAYHPCEAHNVTEE